MLFHDSGSHDSVANGCIMNTLPTEARIQSLKRTIWVFPYMVGFPPISHPKVIICRKTHGFVGETHHFRSCPHVFFLIRCFLIKCSQKRPSNLKCFGILGGKDNPRTPNSGCDEKCAKTHGKLCEQNHHKPTPLGASSQLAVNNHGCMASKLARVVPLPNGLTCL